MTDADTETPARFIAKEGSDGTPFIAMEPGVIRLHFQRPASLDHAERTAKWLNHYFRISIGDLYADSTPPGRDPNVSAH